MSREKDPLLPSRGDGLSAFYKSSNYMSANTFDQIAKEIMHQQGHKNAMNRSQSTGGLAFGTDHINSSSRRTLYGSLPFTAQFGMQSRESSLQKVLSSVTSYESLGPDVVVTRPLNDVDMEDIDSIVLTVPLGMAVLVAVLAQFLVGYNTSVMNAPESVVFPGHSLLLWSVVVASFAIGGPFGAIFGGVMANRKGRRGAMLINCWIFLIGGILMSLAPNIYWLIPARLICGFSSGLASVVVPVYLGEIAPPTLRGALGTLTQFAMVLGILASTLTAFLFSNDDQWRFLFAVTPVLAAIQLIISPFLLESPRWLLGLNSDSQQARNVLRKLRALRTNDEVESEAQNFIFAHEQQKMSSNVRSAHGISAYWELLQNADIQLLLQSAIILQIAQQLCGINAVFYYSTSFFEGTIDNPKVGSALVAFVNVLATYLALKLMDRTPRRMLLIWSCGGMLISTIFIILAALGYVHKFTSVIAVMGFVSFFEIGLGPIPWLIVAEMFDAKYVATAMSVSCIVNWACNFLVGVSFPTLHATYGAYCFVPYGIVLFGTLIYVCVRLPETHGRSLEDIQRLAAHA